jgi:hypothetical protein
LGFTVLTIFWDNEGTIRKTIRLKTNNIFLLSLIFTLIENNYSLKVYKYLSLNSIKGMRFELGLDRLNLGSLSSWLL